MAITLHGTLATSEEAANEFCMDDRTESARTKWRLNLTVESSKHCIVHKRDRDAFHNKWFRASFARGDSATVHSAGCRGAAVVEPYAQAAATGIEETKFFEVV